MTQPDPPHTDSAFSSAGLLVSLAIVAIYLPFIPRGFYGDDWFWLEWAQRSLHHPELLLARPIYGYFRPLYMVYMAALFKLFGFHAFLFGVVNLVFHALNCYLLQALLYRCGQSRIVAVTAEVIFGCYFLYASSICWISAGSDILTVTFLLWLTFSLESLVESPAWSRWLKIAILCAAATLVKETGLISLLLVLIYLVLRRKNPFVQAYRRGSLALIFVACVYLVYYFATRTFVDKDIVLGWRTPINFWYLFVYQVMPISQRLVALAPSKFESALSVLRIVALLLLPALWVWLFRRSGNHIRYLLIWGVIALLPVAILDWNLSLFALYPERTASRFMYSAAPGLAVLIALIVNSLARRIWRNKFLIPSLLVIFGIVNGAAIYKVTQLYRARQRSDQLVYGGLAGLRIVLKDCDRLIIMTDSVAMKSTPFVTPDVLSSMSYLANDRDLPVSVDTGLSVPPAPGGTTARVCRLYWDSDTRRFLAP